MLIDPKVLKKRAFWLKFGAYGVFMFLFGWILGQGIRQTAIQDDIVFTVCVCIFLALYIGGKLDEPKPDSLNIQKAKE